MDARLKLGVRDAREKLRAKDARFRIKGKLQQDARQMLNSRKQQVPLGDNPAKMMDAREKISLKRRGPAVADKLPNFSASSGINITKTIQILQEKSSHAVVTRPMKGMRINVVTQPPVTQISPQQDVSDEEDEESGHIPMKQIKFTAAYTQKGQTRMSLPLTKVVHNDAYTVPVAAAPAPSQSTKTFSGVSRTLVANAAPPLQPVPKTEPACSPLEGTKMTVNNLHPKVTEEDIVELFCACGALKRARLLSPGVAEVVFVRKEDAVGAYKKYNNRYLDGQPMKCNLHMNGAVITSDQPILLRLSDTPSSSSSAKKNAEMKRNSSSSSTSNPVAEVDPETILKALFKSSGSSAAVNPTAFKIKL
ncbi:PREDICTED: polymerase delta-interacting protein 3 [Nanorana parkeri]|uniref:polymerase delta-interacting protein 3 n=1 Tax=Nanorana parkeri TaxID=125878 RepID=UPI000854FF10|nr:PREDICTED: polymerase delta-interacting protein 3 [Nanorana parkeri]